VLQGCTLDTLAFSSLPADVREALSANGNERKPDEKVEIYTHFYLDETGENFLSYEEVNGVEIEGTAASYPRDACPFIPVRMIRQDGENYGRSYVEDYLGDLQSLENLSKAIVGFSMISSKVVGLVNPAGITQPRRITQAQTGDFVPGRPEDVSFLQLQKSGDFSVAQT
ncbi:UNVERIFIED_CONTAM: portal protein, partial [Kocuria sp. CPCC 205274]